MTADYETAIHKRLREIVKESCETCFGEEISGTSLFDDAATQILAEFDVLDKADWTKSSRLDAEMKYR